MNKHPIIKQIIYFSFLCILVPVLTAMGFHYFISTEYSRTIIDIIFISLLCFIVIKQKYFTREFKYFKNYTEKRFDDNKISRNAIKIKIKKLENLIKEEKENNSN